MSRQQRPQLSTTPYRLEEPVTGQYVALTDDGPRLVVKTEASQFPTADAARLAAGTEALDIVRVDA